MELELSASGIGAVVSALIFILSALVPTFAQWWDFLQSDIKRAIISGAGLLTALALVGLHFAGAVDLGLGAALDWSVVWQAVGAWFAFAGGSWALYSGVSAGRAIIEAYDGA